MRALVTGATGFIGHRLVERLIADGEQVTILHRGSGAPPFTASTRVRACTGDVCQAASVRRAMEECDRVYHLAAYAKSWAKDPSVYTEVNVGGLRNVLHAARDARVRRVVYISTAVTISVSPGVDADEEGAPPEPARTLYERSKILAEAEARHANAAGLPIVTVNPTRVFGPGRLTEANSVTRLIQLYICGRWRWVLGSGEEIGNYAYVDDVVSGLKLAMEMGRPGERYILGGTNIGFSDFLETVASVSHRRPHLFHVPAWLALLVARIEVVRGRLSSHRPAISPEWVRTFLADSAYSSAKAERELLYRLTPFREAIEQTVAWLEGGRTAQVRLPSFRETTETRPLSRTGG